MSADPRLVIYSLDEAVVRRTLTLSPITEMHDRQIVATVLVLADQGESVTLLTCDLNITEAGLLTILW